jgi:hypothetical protein
VRHRCCDEAKSPLAARAYSWLRPRRLADARAAWQTRASLALCCRSSTRAASVSGCDESAGLASVARVELFEQIRKDRRVEGASIRELADRHHVHRRTVWQALPSACRRPSSPGHSAS